jgi:hypothetical protein
MQFVVNAGHQASPSKTAGIMIGKAKANQGTKIEVIFLRARKARQDVRGSDPPWNPVTSRELAE